MGSRVEGEGGKGRCGVVGAQATVNEQQQARPWRLTPNPETDLRQDRMESGQEERGQENEKRSGVAGEGRKVRVQGDRLSGNDASADAAVEP